MSPEEKDELYFLRMERAVSDGVQKGMDRHVSAEHVVLNATLAELKKEQINMARQLWTAGGIVTGVGLVWEFLRGN